MDDPARVAIGNACDKLVYIALNQERVQRLLHAANVALKVQVQVLEAQIEPLANVGDFFQPSIHASVSVKRQAVQTLDAEGANQSSGRKSVERNNCMRHGKRKEGEDWHMQRLASHESD